ncbi:Uncharacterized protein BP5553_07378 [Venustampulla echinocandica]|uniref:Extracellular membrane protein CFEM domain-containing protein n=1 Tax=Venustampulla echinocandica TaxID=2656787 RepID=A0A370TJB7_9HELO|nr:Uncharacterized protein BP5553_07378 [Venustampulla echinocandica]RDL35447.1 Uncharacterized protein BP5553_07378 [Venustampulla echinocandica]
MQLTSVLVPLLSLLPALVASTACVAGGPAAQVTSVKNCCLSYSGTWYQFYPNQAICVVADNVSWKYNNCVSKYSELDTRCIPGDGAGLSTAFGSPTYTGPRETITAA